MGIRSDAHHRWPAISNEPFDIFDVADSLNSEFQPWDDSRTLAAQIIAEFESTWTNKVAVYRSLIANFYSLARFAIEPQGSWWSEDKSWNDWLCDVKSTDADLERLAVQLRFDRIAKPDLSWSELLLEVMERTASLAAAINRQSLEASLHNAFFAAAQAASDAFCAKADKDRAVKDAHDYINEDRVELRATGSRYRDNPYLYAREHYQWPGVERKFVEYIFCDHWVKAWRTDPRTPWFATWGQVDAIASENAWPSFLDLALIANRISDFEFDYDDDAAFPLDPYRLDWSHYDFRPAAHDYKAKHAYDTYFPMGDSQTFDLGTWGLELCRSQQTWEEFDPLLRWEQRKQFELLKATFV